MAWEAEFPLRGPGGEPVDLWRTLNSHGTADLPPMRLDEQARTYEMTIRVAGVGPRTLTVGAGRRGHARVRMQGRAPGARAAAATLDAVRHVLRMDADLSPFYALAADDPALSWAASGAGRLVRAPTVFEDVIKTVCTTNCAWSATARMTAAIVEHLGDPAPGAPAAGWRGRAFPTPEAMAQAGEDFYREIARAGYRGAYMIALARSVADGTIDLERYAADRDTPDDVLYTELLALPGVGPYAAAHIMTLLGRYSRLVFDSWTRPTYARLAGKMSVKDAAIERRFRRYGPWAGLAFWLFLTRGWVPEESPPA